MKKYKGGIFLEKFVKCIVIMILTLLLICWNYSYVKADTAENVENKFYMDKEKYDVEEGEEIPIKLNLSAFKIIGCVSVLEYDKELTLVNIEETTNIAGTQIYSPQMDEDGKISEIEVNGKKRFIFTVLASNFNGETVKDDIYAEITIKVPYNVPKGKTYTIGWNKDPELTYMEDFNGTKKLEPFKDATITVVKSNYVESTTIEDGVKDTLNGTGNNAENGTGNNAGNGTGNNAGNGTGNNAENDTGKEGKQGSSSITETKTSQDKDKTIANRNHVQAGSISSYICICIICGLIILTLYFKHRKK